MPDYKFVEKGVVVEYAKSREFIDEQVKIAKQEGTYTTVAFECDGTTNWSVDEIHKWFPEFAVGWDKLGRITVSWK